MKRIITTVLLGVLCAYTPVKAGSVTIENKSSFNVDLKFIPTGENGTVSKGYNKRFLTKDAETTIKTSSLEKSDGTEDIQITFKAENSDKTYLLSGTKTGAGIASAHTYNFAMCRGMDPDQSYKVTISNSRLGKNNGLHCKKKVL